MPKVLDGTADTWKQTAEIFGDTFCELRQESDGERRSDMVRDLRDVERDIEGEFHLGW